MPQRKRSGKPQGRNGSTKKNRPRARNTSSRGESSRAKAGYIVPKGLDTKASNPLGKRGMEKINRSGRATLRGQEDAAISSQFADLKLGMTAEHTESIMVVVNPYILWQYLCGISYSTLSETDRPSDINTCANAAYQWFSLIVTTDLLFCPIAPRAVVELMGALQPRTVGKYAYTPVWDACEGFVQFLRTTGAKNFGAVGFDVPYYSAPQTVVNGFTAGLTNNTALDSTANMTIQQMTAWQETHASRLDLVSVMDFARFDDRSDASAFATDAESPTVSPGGSVSSTPVLCFMSGFNTTSPLFTRTNSICTLETPIKRPHLARLRLGTIAQQYGTYYTTPLGVSGRRSLSQIEVRSSPGTLGFATTQKSLPLGLVQLKLVPSAAVQQGLVDRLTAFGQGRISTWLSTFSTTDIQILAYVFWKRHLRRYSGAEVGQIAFTPLSGSILAAEPYGVHINDTMLDSLKIPEPIMKFLGAQSMYVDKAGPLIPFATLSDYTTIVPPATYTGSSIYGAYPGTIYSNRGLARNSTLFAKYKLFEAQMAQYCNMRYPGEFGNSYLDTTLFRDNLGTSLVHYTMLVSRRKITPKFKSQVLVQSEALSYSIQVINVGPTPGMTIGSLFTPHEYAQFERYDLSDYDLVADINLLAVVDGLVAAGTLASNISGNSGPDFSGGPSGFQEIRSSTPKEYDPYGQKLSVAQGFDYPRPQTPSGLTRAKGPGKVVDRLKQLASPNWGKYCGAGYSAGANGGGQVMEHGRFVVDPDSPEDELCKVHDEMYVAADGDPMKIAHADRKFVNALLDLDRKGGLSVWGRGAVAWFRQGGEE